MTMASSVFMHKIHNKEPTVKYRQEVCAFCCFFLHIVKCMDSKRSVLCFLCEAHLMQGTFPLGNSRGPAHSMSSSAKQITGVWFTSFSVCPPH